MRETASGTPRRLADDELRETLVGHAAWARSGGEGGRRIRAPLDLRGRDLAGGDLRGADLAGSDLRRAILERANLSPAEAAGESIRATLRGSRCEETRFVDAHVEDLDLTGCDLRRSVFSEGAPLEAEQVAGSALTGAVLPRSLDLGRAFAVADESARAARSLLLSMLAVCAYTWVAVASTTDVQLFSPKAAFRLPIIELHVAALPFFRWSALLIVAVFIYLQLTVQRVWMRYALLPSVLPDGSPRSRASNPWLLVSVPQRPAPGVPDTGPSGVQDFAGMLVLWGVPLATLLALWARYLPRRDASLTTFHEVLIAVALAGATASLFAWLRLSGRPSASQSGDGRWRKQRVLAVVAVFTVAYFGLGRLSESARVAEAVAVHSGDADPASSGGDENARAAATERPIPTALQLLGVRPFADLAGAELTPEVGQDDDVSGRKLLSLKGLDLRFADLTEASAVRVDFSGADLRGASLVRTDLRGATFDAETQLAGCDLSGSDLRFAQLAGVDLREVTLDADTSFEDANLVTANPQGLDLSRVKLTGADLSEANLEGTTLFQTILSEATLVRARLKGADLSSVVMEQARLVSADLTEATGIGAQMLDARLMFAAAPNATFTDATLIGANFQDANLEGAHFERAILTNANLAGAILEGSDLSDSDLAGARFDAESTLAGAVTRGMRFLADDVDELPEAVDRESLKLIGGRDDEAEADRILQSYEDPPAPTSETEGAEQCQELSEPDRTICVEWGIVP